MQQTVSPRVDVGAVYETHRGLLVGTAVARYGIAESDAETLVHDVFLAYILKSEEIRDVRAWLVGSICNASKYYLRTRARAVGLPPDIMDEPDPESLIATELQTSPKYAQKLVSRIAATPTYAASSNDRSFGSRIRSAIHRTHFAEHDGLR